MHTAVRQDSPVNLSATPSPISTAFTHQRPATKAIDLDLGFRDRGGADEFRVAGTKAALQTAGVPAPFEPPLLKDDALTVVGEDGHEWRVWGTDWMCLEASRLRTPSERSKWIDRVNARYMPQHFSVDRLSMARRIAQELYEVAEQLRGQNATRNARRLAKQKLERLAYVQEQLFWKVCDMAEMRQELSEVGVFIQQQNFSE